MKKNIANSQSHNIIPGTKNETKLTESFIRMETK